MIGNKKKYAIEPGSHYFPRSSVVKGRLTTLEGLLLPGGHYFWDLLQPEVFDVTFRGLLLLEVYNILNILLRYLLMN